MHHSYRFGAELTLASGPILLKQVACLPSTDPLAHQHPNPRLIFVISGGFEDELASGRRYCGSGSMLFRAGEERHQSSYGPRGASYVGVDIGRGWTAVPYLPTQSRMLSGPRVRTQIVRLRQELSAPDDVSGIQIESILLDVAATLGRLALGAESRDPRWLREIDDYIEAHFSESLSLEGLAKLVHVHPVHLCRTFRRLRGTTITSAIRGRRLERARKLLLGDQHSVGEIALLCGFADQSHFSRAFRDGFGIPPSQYRRVAR